jgi:hypothetical protein
LFAYGRGNYGYMSIQREFQQIATSFAKIIVAHDSFMKTLESEKVAEIPARPNLEKVARFQFFSTAKDRPEGVWLVRQGNLNFALPITVGTKPAISDYLPAPFGLAGFANPVEEVYPALVPFVELEDGKTYAASEGSSLIEPSADGQSLRVTWKKWGRIGSKSGERFDAGLTTVVTWKIDGNKLTRTETISADRDLTIKRWWVAVPSTGTKSSVDMAAGKRTDTFQGRDGTLKVSSTFGWPVNTTLEAAGDSKISKGVLGAIPLHLIYRSEGLQFKAGEKKTWTLALEVSK